MRLDTRHKDSLIAAGITILVALLIFIFLFWGELRFDRALTAAASIPEPGVEDEELFIDPLLLEPGEDESEAQVAPQAEAQGNPEVVENPEVTQPVVEGVAAKNAPPKEKLVTQKENSAVKATEPKATDREKQKAQGKVANAFSNSGNANGRNNASGSGGNSVGITGNTNGWKFLGCPSPKVELRNKVTVKVEITVNAKGKVTSARASGGTAEIRSACEAAARKATWEPLSNREGKSASGTITFTITPR